MTAAAAATQSIGEVLALLRPEFPEITISKIRFLEAEGLITPERTPSGYRKFSREDVSRLRYVLAAQRDQYLPLKVIREQLDALDRGLQPGPTAASPAGVPARLSLAAGLPGPDDFLREPAAIRLSRAELCTAARLRPEQVAQLEEFGLLTPRNGYYDADALVVARAVQALAEFGLEPRHLRGFRSAADREIGLFEQVVVPLARQRGPEARGRAEETVRELAALSVRLHAALVKAGLARVLGS